MCTTNSTANAILQNATTGSMHACSYTVGPSITYRLEGFRVIMNRFQMLDSVEADPQDCAFGDEVAPDMHIPRGNPVCAGCTGVQPQRLLQATTQRLVL